MSHYDVVVAGAGPAGGSCARELAQRGRRVLLIERSAVIGEPDFSTGATPAETLEKFSLPESVTDSDWSSALFATQTRRSELVSGRRLGWVLSYKRLKRHLAGEAAAKGTEVLTGATVIAPVMEGERVSGVRFRQAGTEYRVGARVVVEATGGPGFLARRLGLVKRGPRPLARALEFHVDNVSFDREGRLDFYLGPGFVPEGYAWIFPMGGDRAKVGLATFGGRSGAEPLPALLTHFVRENRQTANARIFDVHGGATSAFGGIGTHARDGFLVIGDAAGQINPLAGEGVRHALVSGRLAAEVLDAALDRDHVFSSLRLYDSRWRRYVGRAWRQAYWLQQLARRITRHERACDGLVSAIGRVDTDRLTRICFEYRFGLLVPRLGSLARILLDTLPLVRPAGRAAQSR